MRGGHRCEAVAREASPPALSGQRSKMAFRRYAAGPGPPPGKRRTSRHARGTQRVEDLGQVLECLAGLPRIEPAGDLGRLLDGLAMLLPELADIGLANGASPSQPARGRIHRSESAIQIIEHTVHVHLATRHHVLLEVRPDRSRSIWSAPPGVAYARPIDRARRGPRDMPFMSHVTSNTHANADSTNVERAIQSESFTR